MIIAHTPRAHEKHDGSKPCGCAVDDINRSRMCRYCGAAYDPMEMFEFTSWLCYDCGYRGRDYPPAVFPQSA